MDLLCPQVLIISQLWIYFVSPQTPLFAISSELLALQSSLGAICIYLFAHHSSL